MQILNGILSKIGAESLLSLYPTFVKNIQLPLGIQLWSRFFIYVILSMFFIDYTYIFKHVMSTNGILLMVITLIHVFTSYKGFLLLEGGIAYSIFYTYPLMILLLSREHNVPWYLYISLIGVYILSEHDKPKETEKAKTKTKDGNKERLLPIKQEYEGVLMILLAAFTEALIFFIIRKLPTNNHWNHMFLSYFMGAILFSLFYFGDLMKTEFNTKISWSLLINAMIGLFGYLLRFYSIANLPAIIYSPLSYLGILMAYVYGVAFDQDVITLNKIIGTLCILIPNMVMLFMKTS